MVPSSLNPPSTTSNWQERKCPRKDCVTWKQWHFIAMQWQWWKSTSKRFRWLTFGGSRDVQGVYRQLGLNNSPQLYETLEHRMIIAEAAQRLRLPLISKDGEIHEEEIEKCSVLSRTSLYSTSTGTISSSSNSTSYPTATGTSSAANNHLSLGASDVVEPGVGGVPNCFLGITPAYLWQTKLQQTPFLPGHGIISGVSFT